MSSTGTGYDLEASTFSPDGRIFQIEYANKAVDNAETAIAFSCKDGVVIAVENFVQSKLLESHSNPRVFLPSKSVAAGGTGRHNDLKELAFIAADEALQHFLDKDEMMPIHSLTERVSAYIHAYTLYGRIRPFGCSIFLGSWDDETGAALYMLDPAGVPIGIKAWSLGKGRQAAKTEIEKLNFRDMTCAQLTKEAARILYSIRDQTKDKNLEIDMVWVGKHTHGRAQMVPADVLIDAEKFAKSKIDEDME
uniref:Proteasome subunit alpha type n=1 Tax=Romanomermis culicivorax TaxID=13658 RepID=A0A915II73_ROMCU